MKGPPGCRLLETASSFSRERRCRRTLGARRGSLGRGIGCRCGGDPSRSLAHCDASRLHSGARVASVPLSLDRVFESEPRTGRSFLRGWMGFVEREREEWDRAGRRDTIVGGMDGRGWCDSSHGPTGVGYPLLGSLV